MSNFQPAYDKSADYAYSLLYRFWVWLGDRLGIEPTKPEIWTSVPEPIFIEVPVEVPIKGENRPNRKKLTKREVSNVRDLARAGHSQRSIAEIYDINPATVSRIVRGLYYKERQPA